MAKGVKTGGRSKGTPNKLTGTVKEMILQAISMEIENLPAILKELEPKEKADFVIKLLPYILPKAKEVSGMQGGWTSSHDRFVEGIMEKMRKSPPLKSTAS
ncbi:hypothetical protein [Mangrovibacterium diazotrophicum]|uniref:Uncharacterized protein n=1 Tax=Mangrovibacterium diazotrophicum TaxID=1261403 RepID=A0A419W4P7_9BACT|nr:hypothetical protein [Mangrovibacterium diazotrophicum]RKD90438.1 hypothetical protein BC643_0777 [Mangrovibacterium diazotrophicum]